MSLDTDFDPFSWDDPLAQRVGCGGCYPALRYSIDAKCRTKFKNFVPKLHQSKFHKDASVIPPEFNYQNFSPVKNQIGSTFSVCQAVLDCLVHPLTKFIRVVADSWNFGLCATIPREPRQARKGATVTGHFRVPRSTRSSSDRPGDETTLPES